MRTSTDRYDHALDLFADGFSPRNARVLVELADRAYDEHTHRDEESGTDVLVTYTPDAVIIAFRGTSEIRDWIVDAKFLFANVSCGRCHFGFWFAWQGIKERLRPLLKDTRPLYFTGHSLGGALAQIAAKWFAVKGCLIGGVYTFGSPRVWDRQAADSYNKLLLPATFNLVNACDPVPLMPPLLLGYCDGGHEIYFLPIGLFRKYALDPFIGWEWFVDLLGALNSYRKRRLAFLPNHFRERYIGRVNTLPHHMNPFIHFAEASNAFTGEWVFAAAAIFGLIIAVGTYFATNRDMEKAEARIAANEETSAAIRAELKETCETIRSEIKKDREDMTYAGERRSYTIHNRINPLVENTAAIKASNEAFVKSFDNFTEVMKSFANAAEQQTELLRDLLKDARERKS